MNMNLIRNISTPSNYLEGIYYDLNTNYFVKLNFHFSMKNYD